MNLTTKSPTKNLVFILNGKSGGKTLFCTHTFAFLVSQGISVQLIEGDVVTLGLTNYHEVPRFDLTVREECRRFLDAVQRSAQNLYLIDTPAASTEELLEFVAPMATTQYEQETGIHITVVVLMNGHQDSRYQAQIICDYLSHTDATVIEVLNNYPDDVTRIYAASDLPGILEAKIKSGNACVITMPPCKNTGALAQLQELGLDAHRVQGQPSKVMQPFDQADVNKWYHALCEQLSIALPLILPKGQKTNASGGSAG